MTNLALESEVAQSSQTLCDPMDCSLPGSSAHGIFQARVLEWVDKQNGQNSNTFCLVKKAKCKIYTVQFHL